MNQDNNNENGKLGFTLKFGNQQGTNVDFGMIDSNPNAPYNPNNNIKLYDSKDTYNRIPFAEVIMCNIDCQEFLKNTSIPMKQDDFNITTQENTKSPISITTSQSNSIQPFTYEDSNITAKEIINKDNTSTLVIESNTNLLEYQGNTADTLMSGLSGVF
ncbi:hypothetical protein, partial [Helicobacter sp. MIT 03-1614]|uniref:hypothetical protein n=1 Tax=Helicobacter sp. MIT 03-1614 TaxID=1548147 RepID=UPI001F479A78